MPVPSTQRATSAVISVKPGPAVSTMRRPSACLAAPPAASVSARPVFARLMTPAP